MEGICRPSFFQTPGNDQVVHNCGEIWHERYLRQNRRGPPDVDGAHINRQIDFKVVRHVIDVLDQGDKLFRYVMAKTAYDMAELGWDNSEEAKSDAYNDFMADPERSKVILEALLGYVRRTGRSRDRLQETSTLSLTRTSSGLGFSEVSFALHSIQDPSKTLDKRFKHIKAWLRAFHLTSWLFVMTMLVRSPFHKGPLAIAYSSPLINENEVPTNGSSVLSHLGPQSTHAHDSLFTVGPGSGTTKLRQPQERTMEARFSHFVFSLSCSTLAGIRMHYWERMPVHCDYKIRYDRYTHLTIIFQHLKHVSS